MLNLGHSAYEKDTPTYHEIVKEFGKEVLKEDGDVNRRELAKVFEDPVSFVLI